ncbi:MAG: SusD/RagB family nutrient-binding outer membrane lipoprotein, partial [Cyclobacteriaceae bacterium]
LRTSGSAADIREAYLEGIEASFDEFGADGYSAYVAQSSVDPGAGNITLEQIMTQKYIGLFVQPEAYSDWRRTGIPSLSPVSGSVVPVRWPIGSDEILFNSNAPREGDVNIFTDNVGWDR